MARGIEKRDVVSTRRRDLVGANVLRDSAGLARHDVRFADVVEERRLPVIDVAHDRYDGRSRLQLGVVFFLDFLLGLFELADPLDLVLVLGGQNLDRVLVEALVDRRENAAVEELLDEILRRHFELVRQIL